MVETMQEEETTQVEETMQVAVIPAMLGLTPMMPGPTPVIQGPKTETETVMRLLPMPRPAPMRVKPGRRAVVGVVGAVPGGS